MGAGRKEVRNLDLIPILKQAIAATPVLFRIIASSFRHSWLCFYSLASVFFLFRPSAPHQSTFLFALAAVSSGDTYGQYSLLARARS